MIIAKQNKTLPKILAALEADGEMTAPEIIASTGATARCVERQIRRLLADGHVHIVDWQIPPGRGRAAAVYALGPGDNVPPPKRPTASQRRARKREWQRKYRARKAVAKRLAMTKHEFNPFAPIMAQLRAA
jgi:REV protein (anti-repression trans-activator protein).